MTKKYQIRKNEEDPTVGMSGTVYPWMLIMDTEDGDNIQEFETFEEAVSEMDAWEDQPDFLWPHN